MTSHPPTRPPQPIRLVLVDDHALMREGIRTILSVQEDLEVVGQAGNGEEALTVIRETRPDIVCMDVEMPGMGGIEATRRLTADPDIAARVLVLTTFDREDYLIAALRAGASGFLLKNSRPEQLAAGVRAIAAGEALLAPELTMTVIRRAVAAESAGSPTRHPSADQHAAALIAQPGRHPHPVGPRAVVVPLTDRELEVLRLLATGLSNDEIATQLVVGRATVKTHVSNVLAKLGLRDRVQAVAYAYRTGLIPLD